MKNWLVLIMLFFGAPQVYAWHIIGGEIYYTCLGNNNYRITLKIYRDCNSTTPFDNPAIVAVYNSNKLMVQRLEMFHSGATFIPPDLTNPCLQVPPGVCVEEAVYETEVFLGSSAGGYDISYQRCCRNSTIVNIVDPSNTGGTYTTHIPDPSLATCNSSPRFSLYPPIIICANEPLIFDHSATDPDGDELEYSLCAPFQGADANVPAPDPPPPPPYTPIFWKPPYNVNNQVGGIPAMKVDAVTGLLEAYPSTLGQFVVGICVKEYRNGNLLSTSIRDFQFNVAECDPLIVADFTTPLPVILKGDTMLICGTLTVPFENTSYGTNDFAWDFGVAGITTDVSTSDDPTYTFPSTGIYPVTLRASPGLSCGDTTVKYLELRSGASAGFQAEDVCLGQTTEFEDLSVALDGTLTSWQWDFGDGSVSSLPDANHVYGSSGTFNVMLTVFNSYGCYDAITQSVAVHPLPVPLAKPDTLVCTADPVMLQAANGTSYQWSPDYNISSQTLSNPVVTPEFTTTYTVTVTNSFGCTSMDSVTVFVTDTVLAEVSPDVTICEGESVSLFATGAVYYEWIPPDGLNDPFISNPVASPSSTTTYFVHSMIGHCTDIDTVTVSVIQKPVPDAGTDTTINQGEFAQLDGSGGISYSWEPALWLNDPGIEDPMATPLNTITYTVTVTSENGCKASDSVTITVTHYHLIYAPSGFTPNNDGINDFFEFFTKGIREITEVKIFSRWGALMYDAGGEEKGWDGTYKGKACEMDTYVYYIRGITYDENEISVKGPITLIR